MELEKDATNEDSSKPKSDGWRFDKKKEIVYCGYYIKRKKRQCTHRISANSNGFCTEHSQASLAESRVSDMNARIRHECKSLMSELADKISHAGEIPGIESNQKCCPKQKKMRVSAPKRMANPFSIDLTPSIEHVQAVEMFTNPNLPLHIDIGCAKGRCIERLSKRSERAGWNHLGVEIRGRTVDEAMQRVANDRKNQFSGQNFSEVDKKNENKNLFFLTCNFAASVKELLNKFPREALRLISIQFPDPWKRKKHQRRLIVQKKLVKQLSTSLPPGAVVYLSSDCDNVATWMVDRFLECEEEEKDDDDDGGGDVDKNVLSKENNMKKKKKKCFRLLSTVADLESVLTPNMFMKQPSSNSNSAVTCEHIVVTTERKIAHGHADCDPDEKEEDNEEVEDEEDEDEEEDNEEDVVNTDAAKTPPSADSYSWFEANNNPLGELSERELVCEVDWRGVRRCCFMRV